MSLHNSWKRNSVLCTKIRSQKEDLAPKVQIRFFLLHDLLLLLLLLWLYSLLFGLGRFFSFLILYTVGRTSWTGDQPVARPLPTYRTIQIRNKRTQTSMPWVGFESSIPAFERAKTVHALDHAVTVIGTPQRLDVLHSVHSLRTTPWRRVRDWRYRSTVLGRGTRRRWVGSFTPRPLYIQGLRS
jgi:hypothetical protein